MEIRKQDAVERALEHSRDDLPRLKRQASSSKHAWQHARCRSPDLSLTDLTWNQNSTAEQRPYIRQRLTVCFKMRNVLPSFDFSGRKGLDMLLCLTLYQHSSRTTASTRRLLFFSSL